MPPESSDARVTVPERPPAHAGTLSVFVSYSHVDKPLVSSLCDALRQCGLDVIRDETGNPPGGEFTQFARNAIKVAAATVCVVSRHSLASTWVFFEARHALQALEDSATKQFIPCATDKSCSDPAFHQQAIEAIDQEIKKVDADILRCIDRGIALAHSNLRRDRWLELRNHLGELLGQIRERLNMDLTPATVAETAAAIAGSLRSVPKPEDVIVRAQELRELLSQGHDNDARKRLLDFVRAFSDDRQRIREAVALSSDWRSFEQSVRHGRLAADGVDARRAAYVRQYVRLLDEITTSRRATPAPSQSELETGARSVERTLQIDLGRGVARLVELTALHAHDRQILERAVLIRRELSRDAAPSGPAARRAALVILEDLLQEQRRGSAAAPRTETAAAAATTFVDTAGTDVVVQCTGLTKRFGTRGFALQDVSFEARYGEIIGIVGRNSNGKTTLLRHIVGDVASDAGRIAFPALTGGAPVRWSRVRRHMAYVPQVLPAWRGALRSNLHFEAAIRGIAADRRALEAEVILERLGLSGEVEKTWSELAGGSQLLFSLARALVWGPRLLVLDEPLANLDYVAQRVLLQDLRHFAERGRLAVLISSQHLDEIEAVSDKLLVLAAGKASYFGKPSALAPADDGNRFELVAEVGLSELQSLFPEASIRSLYFGGKAFLLATPTDMTAPSILQRLAAAAVPITLFRDDTRSAKTYMRTRTASEVQ